MLVLQPGHCITESIFVYRGPSIFVEGPSDKMMADEMFRNVWADIMTSRLGLHDLLQSHWHEKERIPFLERSVLEICLVHHLLSLSREKRQMPQTARHSKLASSLYAVQPATTALVLVSVLQKEVGKRVLYCKSSCCFHMKSFFV